MHPDGPFGIIERETAYFAGHYTIAAIVPNDNSMRCNRLNTTTTVQLKQQFCYQYMSQFNQRNLKIE